MNKQVQSDIKELSKYSHKEIDKVMKNHMTVFIKSLVPVNIPESVIYSMVNKPLTQQQEDMLYSIAIKIIAMRD